MATQMSGKDDCNNCPRWDGKDPGETLRPWLRSQLHWQIRANSNVDQWGLLLYESLPVGTLARTMAETIPDADLRKSSGYLKILKQILVANQAYIEVELEKAVMDFLYPRHRERNELFTAFVSHIQ